MQGFCFFIAGLLAFRADDIVAALRLVSPSVLQCLALLSPTLKKFSVESGLKL